MQPDEKVAYAKQAYAEGVCPGCGAALEKVAGVADGHRRDGRPWYGGNGAVNDRCPWSADQLAGLVHIGSGMVYGGGTGNASLPRERRDPVIASAIVREGDNR